MRRHAHWSSKRTAPARAKLLRQWVCLPPSIRPARPTRPLSHFKPRRKRHSLGHISFVRRRVGRRGRRRRDDPCPSAIRSRPHDHDVRSPRKRKCDRRAPPPTPAPRGLATAAPLHGGCRTDLRTLRSPAAGCVVVRDCAWWIGGCHHWGRFRPPRWRFGGGGAWSCCGLPSVIAIRYVRLCGLGGESV
jgi:hypothetical protein